MIMMQSQTLQCPSPMDARAAYRGGVPLKGRGRDRHPSSRRSSIDGASGLCGQRGMAGRHHDHHAFSAIGMMVMQTQPPHLPCHLSAQGLSM